MARRAKPKKGKAEAKRSPARKAPRDDGARIRDLEKRLAEALNLKGAAEDQQAATAEILKVVSQSPTDVQPVFDTIVRSAVLLCNGTIAGVSVVRDGMLHHPANYGGSPDTLAAIRRRYPRPLDMSTTAGVAMLTRSVCEAPDAEDPSVLEFTREAGRMLGFRSFISVPMLRQGEAIGAITVTRREPGRFSEGEVALLQTFADQAVIAIENVRLFTELQHKDDALTQAHALVTEAPEQQTATGEILRVISRSPTDVQPVFDTIADSAMQLCGASSSGVLRFDGELVHIAALANVRPEGAATLRSAFPMPASRKSASTRAILTRDIVQITDVFDDPDHGLAAQVTLGGFRSVVSVPMLRDGNPIGAITVGRPVPGTFSERQIALLQTFADQAVMSVCERLMTRRMSLVAVCVSSAVVSSRALSPAKVKRETPQ